MAEVIFNADQRLWLLTTATTSYAIRLDESDAPRHVYWGPALTVAQAAAIRVPVLSKISSVDGVSDEELVVEGGSRFDAPSLQVKFSDGTRAFEWRYLDHTVEDGHLAIRFTDRHYPLEVVLHYWIGAGTDVIERWTTLRHTGDSGPITLLRTDSASWFLPCREDYQVVHTVGGWASEFRLRQTPLDFGETVFTSRRGTSSHQANPWLFVQSGDEVWSGALAWSGSWRITVRRTPQGQTSFTGGFGHEGLSWRLNPGEDWETPVFAGLYAADGFEAASRRWHAYVRNHVLPHPDETRPIVYNSWEATEFDVDETKQKNLAARAAALGCELFVMDDGWFGARTHDAAGLGDWHVNLDRFPGGLDPLIAEVHRLGMRFGLWVEPEMVNPDSELYRQHPDWVMHMPNRTRTTMRNQLVLNFGRPDVAEWAHQWLDELVGRHEIDFLKWDMNRSFSEAGWPAEADQDRLWIDHVRHVYAIIDRLRADHPGLRIEACSGGGGRIDLGMLARTDQAWISDNTDASDRIGIQRGYSAVYPARTMSAWVTDSPNPFTGRVVPLAFRFHVAMAGVLGIGGNLLNWSSEELAEATELVAWYKEIRHVVQHGVRYQLSAGPVTGVQYVLGNEAVVLLWRPSVHFGLPQIPVRLKALDPATRYSTGSAEYDGAVLLHHGFEPALPSGDYASTMIHLTEVTPS
ncbi:alpha-galactosidase [Kibdelosporangium persicum]|uniref:Alpha-galactosidase n=1 Tax=Kibdelosporangium persicum TaxID=2698649 RepID=A0ABX2FGS5_9PSEU|nr:alpha-galactosidase [Kibdelosporangium persicum]NRN69973.1 Alpha-galactosidase [Kibdelosporangium persicum]